MNSNLILLNAHHPFTVSKSFSTLLQLFSGSFSYNGSDHDEELKLELDAITNITHKNLVKLLGYCLEGDADRYGGSVLTVNYPYAVIFSL